MIFIIAQRVMFTSFVSKLGGYVSFAAYTLSIYQSNEILSIYYISVY